MHEKQIIEILIYRTPEEVFYKAYNKNLNNLLEQFRSKDINKGFEDLESAIENSFWKRYGGPWKYNQMYGSLNIFCWGKQIRGDLWLSNKKRFTRISKNKNISLFGKVFEINYFKEMTNVDIINEIDTHLTAFMKFHKRLVLDLECYENIKHYINWKILIMEYDSSNNRSQ